MKLILIVTKDDLAESRKFIGSKEVCINDLCAIAYSKALECDEVYLKTSTDVCHCLKRR